MTDVTRRQFLGFTATSFGGLWLGEVHANASQKSVPLGTFGALYKNFQQPDRKYSIRPFWFWNGKLEAAELDRQIRLMVEYGVFGAYVHNRDGLATPYLSEEWWQAVGAALKTSSEVGFSLCFVDEFEWPSGEARDYWMPGINKSRVVAADPGFRMLRLRPVEVTIHGPTRVEIPLPGKTVLIVAARLLGADRLEGASLRTLPFDPLAKRFAWEVPAGEWRITKYFLQSTYGFDGGTVDLMNPEAVHKFIEVYYEEFHRRYGEYFGNTMPAIFADHEGTYGGQLAWTPKLFETFQEKKGYDLAPLLPALTWDIGPRTEKVRCDYQDVISRLYTESFFSQVNDWCMKHNLEYSGHVWEESLFFGPAYQGDFYRILRAFGNPGCDSLMDWGRQPVWLKEIASIADFEGRYVVCENQGVQGGDSYLSPQRMRLVSNSLGAWNVGQFIPHAFDYDLDRINFPPDWFFSQPFLPYFRAYADQMRRVSFMNCASRHVALILLYYPQVSIWGQSAPAYLFDSWPHGIQDSVFWSEDANQTNSSYAELKLRLSEKLLDYKIADDSYLTESHIEVNELVISTSRFRALVLPPMSTMRRASAERAAAFVNAGGTVVALRRLPFNSVEEGRNDPRLKSLWESTFDLSPTLASFTLRSNAKGGRAYFVPGGVEDVVVLLGKIIAHDVEVITGPGDHLQVLHKIKDGIDFFWVVNDTPKPRTNLLKLRATGRPERWDAATGNREPVFYQTLASETLVRLTLQAWDAAYVIFDPQGPCQPWELLTTNLDELVVVRSNPEEVIIRGRGPAGGEVLQVELKDGARVIRGTYPAPALAPLEISGQWTVTVDVPEILLPYAEVRDDTEDCGLRERWFADESPITVWSRLWLSPLNWSIRQWNVIGPFPNPEDHGLEQAFPPEQEVNLQAVYEGDAGREIRWLTLDTAEARVAPEQHPGWEWPLVPEPNMSYAPDSYVVHYGGLLKMTPLPEGTVYAQTNVYSPEEQDAVLVLVTPCPSAVWLNSRQINSRWVRAYYIEMKDGFAHRIGIHLQRGSNSLLLKFLHNKARATGAMFTCRFERPEGGHLEDLVVNARLVPSQEVQPPAGFRWLRFATPPQACALGVPDLHNPWQAFVNGQAVASNSPIPLPPGCRHVVLRVSAGEILDRPFSLSTRSADLELGSWTVPGLEHFSGSMTYTKTLEIPAQILKERVLLDCGEVGVCVEAWVNGAHVGARPWEPFVFDVTDHLQPGRNHLKVRVTNTEGNARAVGESVGNLKNIDLNGWVGPARLVPHCEPEIRCVAV